MGSGSGASMGMGGGGAFDDYGGVDPSMDPELAMAIRASTEEARAQEEARVSSSVFAFRLAISQNFFRMACWIFYIPPRIIENFISF